MQEQNINKLLYELDDLIPPKQIGKLKDALRTSQDNAYGQIAQAADKRPMIAVLLGVFFGFLGLNRYYIRQNIRGIAKLILTAVFVYLIYSVPDRDVKILLCLIYFVIYIIDIAHTFTSCRYVNLKSIYKIISTLAT